MGNHKPAVHLYDYVWLVGDVMGWWIMRIWRSSTYRDSELRGQRCSQSIEYVRGGKEEGAKRKVQYTTVGCVKCEMDVCSCEEDKTYLVLLCVLHKLSGVLSREDTSLRVSKSQSSACCASSSCSRRRRTGTIERAPDIMRILLYECCVVSHSSFDYECILT